MHMSAVEQISNYVISTASYNSERTIKTVSRIQEVDCVFNTLGKLHRTAWFLIIWLSELNLLTESSRFYNPKFPSINQASCLYKIILYFIRQVHFFLDIHGENSIIKVASACLFPYTSEGSNNLEIECYGDRVNSRGSRKVVFALRIFVWLCHFQLLNL